MCHVDSLYEVQCTYSVLCRANQFVFVNTTIFQLFAIDYFQIKDKIHAKFAVHILFGIQEVSYDKQEYSFVMSVYYERLRTLTERTQARVVPLVLMSTLINQLKLDNFLRDKRPQFKSTLTVF